MKTLPNHRAGEFLRAIVRRVATRQHASELADHTDEELAELPIVGLAAGANAEENELVEGDHRGEIHANARCRSHHRRAR